MIFPDPPVEVSIEVEPRCNFRCPFCFNKLSFAKRGRGKIASLSSEYVKKVISQVHKAGTRSVRITGGEPLLHPDILDILEHAGSLGFKEVWLLTNGSLIDNKLAARLVKYAGYFSLPIESPTNAQEDRFTGFKNSLALKLKALHCLKSAGAKFLRVTTVVTRRAIADLDRIAAVLAGAPVSNWALKRPIPLGERFLIDNGDVEILLDKLSAIKDQGKVDCDIECPFPFCAAKDPGRMSRLNKWTSIGGYARFSVDPRGYAKPNFFTDINIGDPLDPLACWNHPLMRKLRNLDFLPDECADCRYKNKCRGGSRFIAKLVSGDYRAPDPLATDSALRLGTRR